MEIAAAPKIPSQRSFVELAHASGFALAGVAPAYPLKEFAFYQHWVEEGMAGPMGYLTDHRMEIRSDPRQLLGSARSVLCLGMLYNTELPNQSGSAALNPSHGAVSRYAWGSVDYHDVLRDSLERLTARLLKAWGDFEYRVCVDTAPLLERGFARAAGLGWIGRNTCLINEPLGSWFFLGEILISLELPVDSPPPDRCGSCTRCIEACPTQALIPVTGSSGPEWQLDARLCISTLTIEQKGPTPEATRLATGDHLFGCDICQQVCPWNQRAQVSDQPEFQPLNARLNLAEMAGLTQEEFRLQFRSTPLWRAKFEGCMRNVATVMGNSGDPRFIEQLRAMGQNGDPGVAAHSDWAIQQLERLAPAIEPGLKEHA